MIDFDPESTIGMAPSPCISVCVMQAHSGLCEGCARTIGEIAQWATAGEDEKRAIWMKLRERRGLRNRAQGGMP
jgi:predicted Fe-S protein YdhL (DUF1289 family)